MVFSLLAGRVFYRRKGFRFISPSTDITGSPATLSTKQLAPVLRILHFTGT
jgi:hypothetical protein